MVSFDINDNEKTKFEKQREILDRLTSLLYREDPNLYYTSTSEIAMILVNFINESDALLKAEVELVKDLTPRDIENIMGYSSNCC